MLLGVVVVASAVGGPWTTVDRFGDRPDAGSGGFTPPPPPSFPPGPIPPSRPSTATVSGSWLSWLLVVAAAVALGLTVWWLIRRFRAAGSQPLPAPIGADLLHVADVAPDLPALRRGVSSAQALLDRITDPADAIVAAWLALEAAAASSGSPRDPAQTPTEFTSAVLQRTTADPAAVSGLLALYLQARFSSSSPAAADVAQARRLLGTLAQSWAEIDRVAAAGPTSTTDQPERR